MMIMSQPDSPGVPAKYVYQSHSLVMVRKYYEKKSDKDS
jgi:hypothetical protein